ncbi:hypothetical protein APA66_32905 [Pseudomonas aeruginosa]|nr:hypothetical protein HW10_30750 [Pseudomonas aeruginosa]MCO2204071.1 hypothetical protein [Pseudomonas aeruginosa]MCO2217215.1 hypothetical protein [Pseudomonas aeruginosa]MCO2220956.1 hypothetical protein [Pseudomonas aeruginosa]MCO2245444.1 hypothetical protein [Pseudomonas aeruginosa]
MEALGRHGAGKNGRIPGQWRNCRPMSLIWVMAAMDAGSRSTDLAFLLGNILARFAAELPKPLRCGLGRR